LNAKHIDYQRLHDMDIYSLSRRETSGRRLENLLHKIIFAVPHFFREGHSGIAVLTAVLYFVWQKKTAISPLWSKDSLTD
jgi:hypothetical protein